MAEAFALIKYPYDFERLPRKLGLLDAAPSAAPAEGKPLDISALGAAELAGLRRNRSAPRSWIKLTRLP